MWREAWLRRSTHSKAIGSTPQNGCGLRILRLITGGHSKLLKSLMAMSAFWPYLFGSTTESTADVGMALMQVRYAKLDGIGAAKVGGRWNPVGTPMVYMSVSDSPAVLEVRVHLRRYIPESYVFATAEIAEDLIERVESHLAPPFDWRDDLAWSQSLGRKFVDESWSVALNVPSRIVPASRNILLNPAHRDFSQVIVKPLKKFEWDERLWERTKDTFRIS